MNRTNRLAIQYTVAAPNAITKWKNIPRAADFHPIWNDLGPSAPLATDCKIRYGGTFIRSPQARNACEMSSTPHHSPPQKMARAASATGFIWFYWRFMALAFGGATV